MCVGVPMQLIEIQYPSGIAEARGVKRTIGLQLLPQNELTIGDYVIVHVGFAIEKLREEEAQEIWKGFDELLRLMDEEEEDA